MHNRWVHSRYCYTDIILNYPISYPYQPGKKQVIFLSLNPYYLLPSSLPKPGSTIVFTGFLVIHHCHFRFTLCSAARVSDAEHNLHYSPPLPKNLQWFPTVLGVKTRILTKRHARPIRIFPTFPDTMANSSATYIDPFSQFLFPCFLLVASAECYCLCLAVANFPPLIQFFKTQTSPSKGKLLCHLRSRSSFGSQVWGCGLIHLT